MSTVHPTQGLSGGRRLRDRLGDRIFLGLTVAAALGAVAVMVAIAWKIVQGARLSFDKFGLTFLTGTVWDPIKGVFGAGVLIYGTAATCLIALLVATPLAIGIGLYLSELAPRGVRGVIGTLVEMLAAIPSVVLGLWGILVMAPFLGQHVEPWLHRHLGFLPIFSGTPQPGGAGMLAAGLILAIMVIPIVASISRELFLSVPRELEEGALALGATRWEMVRGVVLSSSRPGIAAAVILGLGRALGEAIAVAQVIGAGTEIKASLFAPGNTLAAQIADQFLGAVSRLQVSSLFYLGGILLVIGLVTNLLAQGIVRRFDVQRTGLS